MLLPPCGHVVITATIEGTGIVGASQETLHFILIQIHTAEMGLDLIVVIKMDTLFTVICHKSLLSDRARSAIFTMFDCFHCTAATCETQGRFPSKRPHPQLPAPPAV
jgi:hypothetical protein